jgi:hypothetical protein
MAHKRPPGFEAHPERINRKGRFPGARNISTLLNHLLDEVDKKTGVTRREKIMNALLKKSEGGDVRAINELFNRVEGLPKATIETRQIAPVELIDHAGHTDIQAQPEQP